MGSLSNSEMPDQPDFFIPHKKLNDQSLYFFVGHNFDFGRILGLNAETSVPKSENEVFKNKLEIIFTF